MADTKLTALTELTVFNGDEIIYGVDDPGGTPASRKITLDTYQQERFTRQGAMINGKITRTVASNNLTISVVAMDGTTPSATHPVYFRIGNTVRKLTTALTKTWNAGTNWGSLGSSEHATQDIDVFIFVIWNTTPATDILDFGWSRFPGGATGTYADFSTTSTNEKYLAFGNASTPTSTDEVELIGRLNVTLSATASFNWSVPSTSVIKSYPVYETRWLTWVPTITGFSANPTNTVNRYRVDMDNVIIEVRQGTAGTSNATSFTMTTPWTAKTITNMVWGAICSADDNSVVLTAASGARILSATNSLVLDKTCDGGTTAWTGSGTKRVRSVTMLYDV